MLKYVGHDYLMSTWTIYILTSERSNDSYVLVPWPWKFLWFSVDLWIVIVNWAYCIMWTSRPSYSDSSQVCWWGLRVIRPTDHFTSIRKYHCLIFWKSIGKHVISCTLYEKPKVDFQQIGAKFQLLRIFYFYFTIQVTCKDTDNEMQTQYCM